MCVCVYIYIYRQVRPAPRWYASGRSDADPADSEF